LMKPRPLKPLPRPAHQYITVG